VRPRSPGPALPAGYTDFRRGEITDYLVLLDFVHDDLVGLAVAGNIELHWLVDGAVSLLHDLVVGNHADRESVLLRSVLRTEMLMSPTLDGAGFLRISNSK